MGPPRTDSTGESAPNGRRFQSIHFEAHRAKSVCQDSWCRSIVDHRHNTLTILARMGRPPDRRLRPTSSCLVRTLHNCYRVPNSCALVPVCRRNPRALSPVCPLRLRPTAWAPSLQHMTSLKVQHTAETCTHLPNIGWADESSATSCIRMHSTRVDRRRV